MSDPVSDWMSNVSNSMSSVSYWMSSVDDDLTPRPGVDGDIEADVAIVGAGYTGLWTAYYLSGLAPQLRIVVVEAEIAGFGASGRNGGWCSALYPESLTGLARRHGAERPVALYREMQHTVDEVGRVAATEGIDCHFHKGGTVVLARSAAQLARAREEVDEARSFGFGEEDLRLLGADEARQRCGASRVLGGTYTPHCAAIHPARLARGLARVVERRGVRVYEQTRATALEPRTVHTVRGRVRADVVVRATEGYTPALPGHRRTLAPIYSLMIATEPLPASFWAGAGLAERETFSDHRNLIIYGQRTADDRLAFGGRGAPYHYGSAVRTSYDREPRIHVALAHSLRGLFPDLFPRLGEPRITHAWGGPLGVARDWTASVGYDRLTGLAWGGGYVGDGVATANLAGRTLAHLISGTDSDLTALPWVGHRWRQWEPEPLRWLGVNAGLWATATADRTEARFGRPSRLARLVHRFTGG